jgi:hypothetical protein
VRTTTIAVLALLLPAVAHGHPGHGSGDPWGIVHHLSEPLHLAGAVAVAVLLGVLFHLRHRGRRDRC